MTKVFNNGFSLIELIVVMAVLAISITAGIPAMSDYSEKNYIRSAAGTIYGYLQQTRSKAITRSNNASITFTTSGATFTGYPSC